VNNRLVIIGGVCIGIIVLWFSLSRGKKPEPVAQADPKQVNVAELYKRASGFEKDGDYVKARVIYQEILKKYPDYDNIMNVQKDLEGLNMNLIFSTTTVPGKTLTHEVMTGDTLGKIAKRYGTTVELIKKSNALKSDVIRVAQKLRIWTGHFNIFVDKSQNVLILKDGEEIVKVYLVSTGENSSTPVGTFKITSKLVDPVWFSRGIIVPPESPENVLGTRWMGFDIPGYGIHGTIEPETIGQAVTAGCVRMRNEDVEELYSLIPMGTEVVIVD